MDSSQNTTGYTNLDGVIEFNKKQNEYMNSEIEDVHTTIIGSPDLAEDPEEMIEILERIKPGYEKSLLPKFELPMDTLDKRNEDIIEDIEAVSKDIVEKVIPLNVGTEYISSNVSNLEIVQNYNRNDNSNEVHVDINKTLDRKDYIIAKTSVGYLCKWCSPDKNNTYILEKQLMNHLKERHPKEFNLTKRAMSYCDLCEKQFDNQGALNTHKSARHNKNIKSLKCEYCTQTFDKLHNLNRHEREDHPDKHKELLARRSTCIICEKSF